MYENFILFDQYVKEFDVNFNESEEASDQEIVYIDYKQIEDSMYNALKRLDTENKVQDQLSKSAEQTDIVEFASGTDARYYTLETSVAPTSSAQQTTAYLLDIRNILLLLLFVWFLVTVYSKIKNLFINYYGKED